jgi:hypothetical protein
MKNKKNIGILITIILLLTMLLTGCNKQIIDLDYTYNKAVCNVGGEPKEIKIKSWKDYDGEQLQITDKEGTTYLVSSINCTLIRD